MPSLSVEGEGALMSSDVEVEEEAEADADAEEEGVEIKGWKRSKNCRKGPEPSGTVVGLKLMELHTEGSALGTARRYMREDWRGWMMRDSRANSGSADGLAW